jgi:hypothetical protein
VSLVYPLIQPFQWFFATTALLNLGAQMISLVLAQLQQMRLVQGSESLFCCLDNSRNLLITCPLPVVPQVNRRGVAHQRRKHPWTQGIKLATSKCEAMPHPVNRQMTLTISPSNVQ